MNDVLYYGLDRSSGKDSIDVLKMLLSSLTLTVKEKGYVGIKTHWGEKGNRSFLPPIFTREIANWIREQGCRPFIFDTTVLYSGGRHNGSDSLKTAAENGYSKEYLGCPVVIGDGIDGRNIMDIHAGFHHFKTVQVASIIDHAQGFVILSHFKGHMVSGFGGAIKNLSMGFASRAQKQRMHADVHPELNRRKCIKCGDCTEVCPVSASVADEDQYPVFDLDVCIGCAQCIGICPEMALKIFWDDDSRVFQEKMVETAAAVWEKIKDRSVLINALLNITQECDCYPGSNPSIAADYGFIGGYHPVLIDEASLKTIGTAPFNKAHPGIDLHRQFEYAREINFFAKGDEN
jgi:hypothetical protein